MKAAIDLTGQTFGLLTVLHRTDEQTPKREWLWLCRCACEDANTKLVTGSALRKGDTSSCGCIPRRPPRDLTGQKFNHLTAIRRLSQKEAKTSSWLCQCDCTPDRTTVVTAYNLRAGIVQSCGCLLRGPHTKDLSGQVFGRWTVLRRDDVSIGSTCVKWVCQCSCITKTIRSISAASLKKGTSKSCGCLRNELALGPDLTGRKFSKLTVLYRSDERKPRNRSARWVVQCDCDPEGHRLKTVAHYVLTGGITGSCGCASRLAEIVRSDRSRQRAAKWTQRQIETNPKYVLSCRVRALVNQTLKNRDAYKSQSIMKSLTFTVDELESHLKMTIPCSFTWDDFLKGRLQIDHIKPIASFAFTCDTDPGFKDAWALSNLQLLTPKDNLLKRAQLNWTPPNEN